MTAQYYKIDKKYKSWHGVRFFKMTYAEFVVQVCHTPGEVKKGRGHTVGIYTIARLTFFSNYLAMNYAVPCRKSEYDKAFKLTLSLLK